MSLPVVLILASLETAPTTAPDALAVVAAQLVAGERVRVRRADGSELTGDYVRAGGGILVLEEGDDASQVSAAEVSRVWVRRTAFGRGALIAAPIGALAGAGLGLVFGAFACKDEGYDCSVAGYTAFGAAFGAGVAGGLGGMAGTAAGHWAEIYPRPGLPASPAAGPRWRGGQWSLGYGRTLRTRAVRSGWSGGFEYGSVGRRVSLAVELSLHQRRSVSHWSDGTAFTNREIAARLCPTVRVYARRSGRVRPYASAGVNVLGQGWLSLGAGVRSRFSRRGHAGLDVRWFPEDLGHPGSSRNILAVQGAIGFGRPLR